jgi:DHA1 family multidrug resistance protein-like MFS transporter
MAGQGVVSPIVPLFAKEFGVSTTMVGLTLTVFALARLILNVPAGMIADRFGRRWLLVGGPIVTSIGMFGSSFAGDIWTLLAWRFVAGSGSALYMSGALVYLIDISRPDQRARFVATNQWALILGVALGPPSTRPFVCRRRGTSSSTGRVPRFPAPRRRVRRGASCAAVRSSRSPSHR